MAENPFISAHGEFVTGEAAPATRERIKLVARELYVQRGHDGFSFGDIAERTATTRANIHYHFGNKRQLMAEIIADFVQDATERIGRHWTTPGSDFAARWHAQLEDLRRFYARFNPAGDERSVWSPMSRLRLDMGTLGTLATAALSEVNAAYDRCLRHAVTEAIAAGEFRADAPVEDIVQILRVTMLSCGPITQDTGSFADVERLFGSVGRVVAAAWGTARLHASLSGMLDRLHSQATY